MVEDMLNNSELSVQEIDAVAVAAGPGSRREEIEAQPRAVAHDGHGAVHLPDVGGGLLQGDGSVLPQAGQLPALRQKDGVIDLLPPGVHGTDNIPLQMDFLTARGVECRLAPVHLRQQSAVGVAMAAWRRRGENLSAQELTPVYLRLSQAERERLAKGESI